MATKTEIVSEKSTNLKEENEEKDVQDVADNYLDKNMATFQNPPKTDLNLNENENDQERRKSSLTLKSPESSEKNADSEVQ